MEAPLQAAYCLYTASLAVLRSAAPGGMALMSIRCRCRAEFQKSHRVGQVDLRPAIQKRGQRLGSSPSYMRAIWGCWLRSAYSKDVPDRQTPTTNRGPDAKSEGIILKPATAGDDAG